MTEYSAFSSPAMSNPTANRVEEEQHAVLHEDIDIATSIGKESMKIQAPGREPFQRVFLWAASQEGTRSADPYDCTIERSLEDYALLPWKKETQISDEDRPKVVEYLEVGLVMGADAMKYVAKGKERKAREQERQSRENMDRDPQALRVFVPMTDTAAPQCRLYVGCARSQGRLWPKTISKDAVYFYPEFWIGASPRYNQRDREKHVMSTCRRHAARVRTDSTRAPVIPILDAVPDEMVTSRLCGIPRLHHQIHMFTLMLSCYSKTRDRNLLESMNVLFAGSGVSHIPRINSSISL